MNNKPAQVAPENIKSTDNSELLSVAIIKKEFLIIIDNFIEALKNSILVVNLNKQGISLVDALMHNIAIKNDLTFNDFSLIFGKDLRTSNEINTEILNEINAFVSEYSEFFEGGDLFKEIFHKGGDSKYHEYEVKILTELISHNMGLKKHKKESNGDSEYVFHHEKFICKCKLDELYKIDSNIPGYIVLLIFRNILNEQENVKDFLFYASIIQNSFTVKDTAFGDKINEFFLKLSTVESTVDKVNKSVLQNIGKFFTKRD